MAHVRGFKDTWGAKSRRNIIRWTTILFAVFLVSLAVYSINWAAWNRWLAGKERTQPTATRPTYSPRERIVVLDLEPDKWSDWFETDPGTSYDVAWRVDPESWLRLKVKNGPLHEGPKEYMDKIQFGTIRGIFKFYSSRGGKAVITMWYP